MASAFFTADWQQILRTVGPLVIAGADALDHDDGIQIRGAFFRQPVAQLGLGEHPVVFPVEEFLRGVFPGAGGDDDDTVLDFLRHFLAVHAYHGLEIALEAFETDDLRIGENGDLVIRGHLGRKLIHIGPDVGAFNGMMQLSSHAAEFGLLLDQGGFKSLPGEIEGGVHAGDASTDDQGPFVDGDDFAMKRF